MGHGCIDYSGFYALAGIIAGTTFTLLGMISAHYLRRF